MAQIIKINDNTYRIEDGHVRFYLFIGTKKAALIKEGKADCLPRSLRSMP